MYWYRLQYAKKKCPEDIRGFIEEQNKRIIDYMKKSNYNTKTEISEYAEIEFMKQNPNVDEVIAEAVAQSIYGKSSKIVKFIIKEFKE